MFPVPVFRACSLWNFDTSSPPIQAKVRVIFMVLWAVLRLLPLGRLWCACVCVLLARQQ